MINTHEDDDGNVDGAQHAEFVRLFEEAILSLGGGGQGGEDGGKTTTVGRVLRIEKICQDISTKIVTREFQRRVCARAHLEKGHRPVAFVLQENGLVSIVAS